MSLRAAVVLGLERMRVLLPVVGCPKQQSLSHHRVSSPCHLGHTVGRVVFCVFESGRRCRKVADVRGFPARVLKAVAGYFIARGREASVDLGKALAQRPNDVMLRKESAVLKVRPDGLAPRLLLESRRRDRHPFLCARPSACCGGAPLEHSSLSTCSRV